MSKLRISIVQYLNTAPLVRGFTHGPLRGKYDLSFTVPSQCAEELRTGAADVAIIPAIELQRIPNLVVLPDLAIASKERVRSLLMLSKVPIRKARRIALDRSSRSTQALTRILCDARWGISPEFFEAAPDAGEMLKTSDAALLIGDPALRLAVAAEAHAKPAPDGAWLCDGNTLGLPAVEKLHIYDVVREWWQLTERPAVLAVWAARPEVATSDLAEEFSASLEFGLAHLEEICSEAAKDLDLPERELLLYLRTNIDFSLDEANMKGLLTYFGHCLRLGLIDRMNPISLAARSGSPARLIDSAASRSA
ncbi:MAG TPA: menaquinone biosynthesis protein [Terriglobales bacterium]|nr:menaquinone biosynthesis protein [Terriglobales bacterium]